MSSLVAKKTTQVIAVSNRKGGAGKTTVAVNLAAELAALGKHVLLIDLDSQGHCAVGLGLKHMAGDASVHDLFRGQPCGLLDSIKKTHLERLAIAPADQMFDHGGASQDHSSLARALDDEALRARYEFIIIDTPPSLDSLLLNALTAADWVLIPYIPQALSLEGVKQLMRVLFKLISAQNSHLRILGFLPMQVHGQVRSHRKVTGEIARQFGSLRLLGGIRSDVRLAESFAAGQPIRLFGPKCRAAEDFVGLARHVLDIINSEA